MFWTDLDESCPVAFGDSRLIETFDFELDPNSFRHWSASKGQIDIAVDNAQVSNVLNGLAALSFDDPCREVLKETAGNLLEVLSEGVVTTREIPAKITESARPTAQLRS